MCGDLRPPPTAFGIHFLGSSQHHVPTISLRFVEDRFLNLPKQLLENFGHVLSDPLAQLFASNLLDRFEADRPALPALTLGGDNASITAIAQSSSINDIFSRQLRALGQDGDILLCINSSESAGNLLRAIQAAHERNMGVIVMSNTGEGELGTLIRDEDVELQVRATRRARVVEIHTMAIHSFCELIDHSLFGNYPQE